MSVAIYQVKSDPNHPDRTAMTNENPADGAKVMLARHYGYEQKIFYEADISEGGTGIRYCG